MTGTEALRAAVARLAGAGIADPVRDARVLLAFALGIGVDRLSLHVNEPVPEAAVGAFEAAVQARAARRPVSQIIGRRAFWGRSFHVTADVLDPRPETETLIAAALKMPFRRVLDLGVGSGAILLSLLAERPMASGMGVDLSEAAVAVARRNAGTLGVADRAALRVSDWFRDVEGLFDLIVSNPPYIAEAEMAALSPEVRDHEPRMALTPGGDGLAAYRIIAAGAGAFLHPGGQVLLEIGPTQAADVSGFLAAAGFSDIHVIPDFDGRDRVVRAVWQG